MVLGTSTLLGRKVATFRLGKVPTVGVAIRTGNNCLNPLSAKLGTLSHPFSVCLGLIRSPYVQKTCEHTGAAKLEDLKKDPQQNKEKSWKHHKCWRNERVIGGSGLWKVSRTLNFITFSPPRTPDLFVPLVCSRCLGVTKWGPL